METPIDYTAIKILSRPSLDNEHSIGTSLAKVDWLEAENGCCRLAITARHNENLHIYIQLHYLLCSKAFNFFYLSPQKELSITISYLL